jgi:hypothetical protein
VGEGTEGESIMTAIAIPVHTDHDRDVLRMGRYMALARADAHWLWIVVNNLETADINPESAYYKRAVADYDAAALRVRLFTERLLAKLAGRDGAAYEEYAGRVGFNGDVVRVEFWRPIYMVTAKIED